ncbi:MULTISPECIES: CPXCG motif-containing cysteine-rich protein [Nitrincola]|uniref:Cysteine-rich CPXCG n=1 Tax=Nitrincola nitratireducens TaxID=1229521 RepID=W9UQ68_9GAMM|nr:MULTISPECIES: CPXCG motif-containing cysteine-rich protein [Nitrincola]EXJ09264.1 hypothetical protein D791_03837 [Nitrincola nitratireducens]
MNPLETIDLLCPYCSESISFTVDCSENEQEYTEDCPVCCSPVLINVSIGNNLTFRAERENG